MTPEKRYAYWAEPSRIGYFRGLPPFPPLCITWRPPQCWFTYYPKIRISALVKERRIKHRWLLDKSIEKPRHEKYLQFSSGFSTKVNEYCSYYSLQRGRQWNTRIAHMHDNRHSRGQATREVGRYFFCVSPLPLGGHLFNLAFVFTFIPLSRREI